MELKASTEEGRKEGRLVGCGERLTVCRVPQIERIGMVQLDGFIRYKVVRAV